MELGIIGSTANCSFKLDTTLTIATIKPVALFSTTTACADLVIQFTDQSSVNGIANSWLWDFNNDGIIDSNSKKPVHTFNVPGNYPVKLIVTQGVCMDEITKNIIVDPSYMLMVTNQTDSVNTFIDLTKPQVTVGSSGGQLSYWTDSLCTAPLANPAVVTKSGTYYIKLGTGPCAVTKPVIVTLNPVITSIDETTMPALFNVFPNPASQYIVVEAKKGIEMNSLTIELINILGKQMYSYKTNYAGTDFKKQFDISELPKGIYFIHFKTDKSDYLKRIICQ